MGFSLAISGLVKAEIKQASIRPQEILDARPYLT